VVQQGLLMQTAFLKKEKKKDFGSKGAASQETAEGRCGEVGEPVGGNTNEGCTT